MLLLSQRGIDSRTVPFDIPTYCLAFKGFRLNGQRWLLMCPWCPKFWSSSAGIMCRILLFNPLLIRAEICLHKAEEQA